MLADLRAARAAQYPPDPIPSILPGGGVSLIAGASGTGKTAFLAWWTTRFRDGLPIFGHTPSPIPLQAILAIDRSWIQSTSRWFEAVGFPEIRCYSPLDDPEFRPTRFRKKHLRLEVLRECLEKLDPLPRGALVYVDPLAPFLGGNLIDYDACAVACMEIRELCRQRGITILGTAHTAKLKADKKDRYARVQDRILGSSALLGYTDTQMYLASPDESATPYYQFFWNPHHAPQATFNLSRDPETGLFVPAESLPRPEAEYQILGALRQLQAADEAPETIPFAQLVLALPAIPRGSLNYHLGKLMQDGLVERPAAGRYRAIVVS